jgi:hypothetical protein
MNDRAVKWTCVFMVLGWANVKEHATPLAGAGVDTGVEVHTTGDVAERAASEGCCVSACSAFCVGYVGSAFTL